MCEPTPDHREREAPIAVRCRGRAPHRLTDDLEVVPTEDPHHGDLGGPVVGGLQFVQNLVQVEDQTRVGLVAVARVILGEP